MIAAAPRLVFFGLGDEERIVREAGFSALRLAGLLAALAFGVARGRDRDALALILARPLTPTAALLGRYIGALAAALLLLTMLSVVLYGTLTRAGMDPSGVPGAAGQAALEAAVAVALAVALATRLQGGLAALGVFGIFVLAHASARLAPLLPSDGSPVAAALLTAAYLGAGSAVAEAGEA